MPDPIRKWGQIRPALWVESERERSSANAAAPEEKWSPTRTAHNRGDSLFQKLIEGDYDSHSLRTHRGHLFPKSPQSRKNRHGTHVRASPSGLPRKYKIATGNRDSSALPGRWKRRSLRADRQKTGGKMVLARWLSSQRLLTGPGRGDKVALGRPIGKPPRQLQRQAIDLRGIRLHGQRDGRSDRLFAPGQLPQQLELHGR